MPILRTGAEYTDRQGNPQVADGKAPIVFKRQKRRLPWDELERRLRSPEIVALGIVAGHLNEANPHNLAVLDFDGEGWNPVYDNMMAAWDELRSTVGVITRHDGDR